MVENISQFNDIYGQLGTLWKGTHIYISAYFQGLTRISSFPVGDFSFSEEYVRCRHHGPPCYARNQQLFAQNKLPPSNEVQEEIKLGSLKAFVLFRPVSLGQKSQASRPVKLPASNSHHQSSRARCILSPRQK